MVLLNRESLYTNSGNTSVLALLEPGDRRILDIGCGAGDNGQLIHIHFPDSQVTGLTCSIAEYSEASQKLDRCFCLDVERDSIAEIGKDYDVLIFSHVLEHLVDPVAVIQRLLPCLKIGGKIIIAVPNIANWRDRWKLALGRFEYTDAGVMDRTHLHFYTFYTAPRYLIAPIPNLSIESHTVNGSVPLAFLRHHFLSPNLRAHIDQIGCRLFPNFCGAEILIISRHFAS